MLLLRRFMALLVRAQLSRCCLSHSNNGGPVAIYNRGQSSNRAERRGVNSGKVLKYLGLKLKFNGRDRVARSMVRVLVVDDLESFRRFVASSLGRRPEF